MAQFIGFDMYTHKTITPLKIKNTSITPRVPDPTSGPSLLSTPHRRQTLMCAGSLQGTRHFSGGSHINCMMHYVCVYVFLAWLLSLATAPLGYIHADARLNGSFLPALCNGPILRRQHGRTVYSFYE